MSVNAGEESNVCKWRGRRQGRKNIVWWQRIPERKMKRSHILRCVYFTPPTADSKKNLGLVVVAVTDTQAIISG